ncbi:MAG: pirin family protein [Pseudomonadota bacterium]
MSWNEGEGPNCPDAEGSGPVETLIVPRARDLGGFEVRRALPSPRRQLVGPFIFFDQIGPAEFIHDGGIDVRPHPHIGLATVTYLFQGEFQHRDSLGTNQMIYPGEVNWMVSGKGITHSERTSPETRAGRHSLYGIQTWVALPKEHEDTDPSFEHQGADALPLIEDGGAKMRLILGNAYGQRAPVQTFSEMFYADVRLQPWVKLPLPDNHEDRALYVLEGEIVVAGDRFEAGQMMVFRPGDAITIEAGAQGAHFMALGGETFSEGRYISWNFVSSSQEKIAAAEAEWRRGDWKTGKFTLPPGDNKEFIPLD